MPPWYIDARGHPKFKDDPSLTDQEIATIVKWVDAGAPQGNPADMPPPLQFKDDNSLEHRHTRRRHHLDEAPGAGLGLRLVGRLHRRNQPDGRPLAAAVEAKPGVGNKQVTHHAGRLPDAGR